MASQGTRTKGGVRGLLLFVAIIGAFFAVIWVLGALRNQSCGRLNAERISHLQPGHQAPGPDSIYVKGVGTADSELMAYLEAEAEMERAGCA